MAERVPKPIEGRVRGSVSTLCFFLGYNTQIPSVPKKWDTNVNRRSKMFMTQLLSPLVAKTDNTYCFVYFN